MSQRKFRVLKTIYHAEQKKDIQPGAVVDLDYLIAWDAEKPQVRNRLGRLIAQGFVEEIAPEQGKEEKNPPVKKGTVKEK